MKDVLKTSEITILSNNLKENVQNYEYIQFDFLDLPLFNRMQVDNIINDKTNVSTYLGNMIGKCEL